VNLVPASKFDLETAELAAAAGWPAVQPVVTDLLEWLQDYNWPVARVLAPFLASIGDPLVPFLRPILAGDDALWKYWIIQTVIFEAPATVAKALRPELQRLVQGPSPTEVEEEVSAVATAALARIAHLD
jgi:hypothetical protein